MKEIFIAAKAAATQTPSAAGLSRIGNFYSDRSGIWKNPGYFNFVHGSGST